MVSAFRERAVGAATHFLPGWLTRETAVSCWRSRRGRRSPEENVKSRRHRKPPDMADIENLRTWPAQKLSSHGPSHGRTPSGTDRSSIVILRIEGGTSADYRRLVMLATRGFGDLLQAQFLCLPWSPWEVRGWQLTAYHPWSRSVQLTESKYARWDVGGLPEAGNASFGKLKNDMQHDSTRTDPWPRSPVHRHNLHLQFPAPLEAARMDATTAANTRRFRGMWRLAHPVPALTASTDSQH